MAPRGGLGMGETVEVVEHDAAWPTEYERERARIADALGDLALAIEHVGSTAVPSLGAKPVIDILIGVRKFADSERCVRPLDELGYEYRGEAGVPGRIHFRKIIGGVRTHHLDIVEQGSDFWDRSILFRDYLRGHPKGAQEYYELKVRLAAQFADDYPGYTEAKSEFIEAVLVKARAAVK